MAARKSAESEPTTYGDGTVSLTMAHPLDESARLAFGLQAGPEGNIPVGASIKINPAYGRRLISAGMVTVDPEDKAAVKAAIRGQAPENKTLAPSGGVEDKASDKPAADSTADGAQA